MGQQQSGSKTEEAAAARTSEAAEVAAAAAELVVEEAQKTIVEHHEAAQAAEAEKRPLHLDASGNEGPEPEPPTAEPEGKEQAATPEKPRIAVGGEPTSPSSQRSPLRKMPTPLQDDPAWAGTKDQESSEAALATPSPPPATVGSVPRGQQQAHLQQPLPQQLHFASPAPSPEASYHPQLFWPQTPQSPAGYQGLDAQMAAWSAHVPPPGAADVRQALFTQASAPGSMPGVYGQGAGPGGAFLQPYAPPPPPPTHAAGPLPQAPMPPPPPAMHQAPLHFQAPALQPFQHAPSAFAPPASQPQLLRPPQPPQPPQPPPQQQPQHQAPQPLSPAEGKQERRQAAEEALARQQAWFAAMQREHAGAPAGASNQKAAAPVSPKVAVDSTPSAPSAARAAPAVPTPPAAPTKRAVTSSSGESFTSAQELLRAIGAFVPEDGQTASSSTAPAPAPSSTTEEQSRPQRPGAARRAAEKEAWSWVPQIGAPRYELRSGQGKGAGRDAVGSAWPADNGKAKGSSKGKGERKQRPIGAPAEPPSPEPTAAPVEEAPASAARRTRRRGKVSEYTSHAEVATEVEVPAAPERARGRRRGKFSSADEAWETPSWSRRSK
eukprot:TRINITY_DN96284_c0_g1_i1.p1 TRINITY_DN96284_c0_g1~~TRINITY_DN96284_c0_g1_i1.p1  ORF type:complete len:606 (+),score=148.20 TRINITY_DN96284_c0_g1_i1:59-1876(+)